jgi:hypothetical protein
MGMLSAGVSCKLLVDPEGKVIEGDTRVPVLVTPKTGDPFIVKGYGGFESTYRSEEERAVLLRVQGDLAPKVIFFGRGAYAEEYLHPEQYTTLEKMADNAKKKDMSLIAFKGGEGFGLMASKGVYLGHNHWLDEFHLDNSSLAIRITDFGTATRLEHKLDSLVTDTSREYLVEDGDTGFLHYKMSPFGNYPSEGEKVTSLLRSLSNQDDIFLLNLSIFASAMKGLKYYFEYRGNGINSWDLACRIAPDLAEGYVFATKDFFSNMHFSDLKIR